MAFRQVMTIGLVSSCWSALAGLGDPSTPRRAESRRASRQRPVTGALVSVARSMRRPSTAIRPIGRCRLHLPTARPLTPPVSSRCGWCRTDAFCRWTFRMAPRGVARRAGALFSILEIDSDPLALFHTNVIDPVTGGEASNGLSSIPVGATWPSRLKLAFDTVASDGKVIQWAVRFNPRDYPPSDHVSVLRTSLTSWEIFATSGPSAPPAPAARRRVQY